MGFLPDYGPMRDHSHHRDRPLVLVASSAVGAGHDQAARAVLAGLHEAEANVETQFVEVLSLTPPLFGACYVGAFILGMTELPSVYGRCFDWTNRPHRPGRDAFERRRLSMERTALRRFAQLLLTRRPDVVVCTHFLPAPLVGRLRLSGDLPGRHMLIVTDHNVHRWWYAEGVDRWFVPAAPSAAQIRRWGIDDERICVSGIPIHPKWARPVDREKVFADWRLPMRRNIVLLTGGTQFTCGPVVRIARRIASACPESCVLVLAGYNKKLLARLAALPEAGERIVGLPYTDRIHELLAVASVVITKPGGLITAECLSKSAPMILTDPVPGQEAGNAEYFAGEGAAVVCTTVEGIVRQTTRLIRDEQARDELAANAGRLYRPATQTIVSEILHSLRASPPASR